MGKRFREAVPAPLTPMTPDLPLCARCGAVVSGTAKFCPECGTVRAGTRSGGEVRKTVTAVFCDVTGSTALGERLDPEALRAVMEQYFSAVSAVLARHGGTVEKFVGDAVLAVFGVPIAHEDDAIRAARAAVQMLGAVRVLDREVAAAHGVRFEVRIGMETGEVLVGDPGRGATFVSGPAVTAAARLEQAAGAGEAMIGPQTYRLVRDLVDVEPRPGLELKGKPERVTAYRLLGLRDAPLAAGHDEVALVGRGRELALLRQAFGRAFEDRTCQLATVLGTAGVGKSRLMAEFLSGLEGTATVLRGRCLSYGEGVTYWPLVEVVRQAAGLTGAEPQSVALSRLRALLADDPEAAAVVGRVAPVAGLGGTPSRPEDTAWAVQRLLEALAGRRPVVLAVDDLHWAEPSLIGIMEWVCDWARDVPLLVLAVARPEFLDTQPGWGAGKLNAVSALLEPLTDDEVDALASQLLGGSVLPPAVAGRVRESAGGNPLFLEQLLAMLVDDGVLQRTEQGWRAVDDLAALSVPPTITALLTARLDRLTADERAVLASAAVVGQVFYRAAVTELCELGADDVRDRLKALLRKGLVRPAASDLPGQDALRFGHVLVRDAAYARLPKAVRATLHERFARWLDKRATGQAYDDLVGDHLEQAYRNRAELGALDQAARELGREAAERLEEAGRLLLFADDGAAAGLLERAVRLRPDDTADRWAPELELADALHRNGRLGPAATIAERVRAAATTAGDERWTTHGRLLLAFLRHTTEPEGATEVLRHEAESGLEVFSTWGDDPGLARVHWCLAQVWNMAGRYGARARELALAAEHAERAGDTKQAAFYEGVSLGSVTNGDQPAAVALETARAMGQRAPGRVGEAMVETAVAYLTMLLGRTDEAATAKRRAERLVGELRSPWLSANYAMTVGEAELTAGSLDEAVRLFAFGCRELEVIGELGVRSTMAALHAHALLLAGDRESGRAQVGAALAAGAADDLLTQGLAAGALAWLAALDGDPDSANQQASAALEQVDCTEQLQCRALMYVACAEAAGVLGDHATARRHRERAIELFAAKENLVAVGRQRALL